MDKLTERQKLFCDEYLKDLNATQAAIRAGYSRKSARQSGTANMSNPSIAEYIAERMAGKNAKVIAEQDEVLEYLTSVLRGESQSEVVVVEGVGEGCSQARTISKAPDEKERLKAAELLGKRYRLFTENVKITDERPVIVDNIPDDPEGGGEAWQSSLPS